MRRCLPLIKKAVEENEAKAQHAAVLEDLICFHERRPQTYGTVFDWDEQGQMSPWSIEEPDQIEQRRKSVGLPPLFDQIHRCRQEIKLEKARPPDIFQQRQRQAQIWRTKVGW